MRSINLSVPVEVARTDRSAAMQIARNMYLGETIMKQSKKKNVNPRYTFLQVGDIFPERRGRSDESGYQSFQESA